MVDETTMFYIASRIDNILKACEVARTLTPDEKISLKQAIDVAMDNWFDPEG